MPQLRPLIVGLSVFALILLPLLLACDSETPAEAPTNPPTAAPTSTPQNDKAALTALYHSTNGPNWPYNENWLSDAPTRE